ncbi:MAG: calcium-binding protein, partial [Nostoc sp.]
MSIGASNGNNILCGDDGDDTLSSEYSTGNNIFSGGNGNDHLSIFNFGLIIYEGNKTLDKGNNTLDGGVGNDTLDILYSAGNNILSGGDGNDQLYILVEKDYGSNTLNGGNGNDTITINLIGSTTDSLVTQVVDGGNGDDLLNVYYQKTTGGITSTINASTNSGSITTGSNSVNYKNIERLDITGTDYNDNILGSNGNDTLDAGSSGNDTIDGGTGNDLLIVYYGNSTKGITTTINATTNSRVITAGSNSVNYKNIERLDISGTVYDDNILGSNGNDTLSGGGSGNDTINGGNGNDTLFDTLSGGGSGNNRIDGGNGDDLLIVGYGNATKGIISTINPTTNSGSITAGTNSISYKNIEQLEIYGTNYDDNIVGSNGNDTLSGGYGNDTLRGGNG